MIHFVPAWYKQNTWSENEESWYVRRSKTEFDDTVKQVQLFHRSGVYPYEIMLLSHAPNFRHFLHRQGVFRAPYWSCFDSICEIRRKKASLFSYRDIAWPKGTEFEFTPFAMIAYVKGEKYATLDFGEDGNLIKIDMFKDGVIQRSNLYDDRGFVSSSDVYFEGNKMYTDYLMESGIWKMRHVHADGHVQINPKHNRYIIVTNDRIIAKSFDKFIYSSMDKVIEEVTRAYVMEQDRTDIFCVAMHEKHLGICSFALANRNRIYSFYGKRIDFNSQVVALCGSKDYIITDSYDMTLKAAEALNSYLDITDIPPYDTREDFGISQQFTVQKILLVVDGINDEVLKETIFELGRYLLENDKAEIHLFTRNADYNRESRLLETTRNILVEAGMDPGWATVKPKKNTAENRIDDENETEQRFFVEQCIDELSVTKCVKEQRLVVDVSEEPEQYVQIAAISAGLPQITRRANQYVRDGRNGYVIDDIHGLGKALRFYLTSLANWNDAMIDAVKLGKQFSTDALLKKWKEVIEFIG